MAFIKSRGMRAIVLLHHPTSDCLWVDPNTSLYIWVDTDHGTEDIKLRLKVQFLPAMARNCKKVAKPKLVPNPLHFERMVRVFDAMETPHLTRATRTKRKLLDEVSFFLTLPQELRDMVYHELWKARPQISLQTTQKGRLQAIKLQYGSCESNPPIKKGLGLPRWLLTNMVFLNERLD
jgi:hypothetical protein